MVNSRQWAGGSAKPQAVSLVHLSFNIPYPLFPISYPLLFPIPYSLIGQFAFFPEPVFRLIAFLQAEVEKSGDNFIGF